MRRDNRELFAHLARALTRYVPEAERESRQMGYVVPPELMLLADFFGDCARTRQDATSGGDSAAGADGGVMRENPVLTKREAAAELRLSVRQVERLIAAKKLTAVKLEGATRIRRADLTAYIDGLVPRSFRDSVTEKGTA